MWVMNVLRVEVINVLRVEVMNVLRVEVMNVLRVKMRVLGVKMRVINVQIWRTKYLTPSTKTTKKISARVAIFYFNTDVKKVLKSSV